MADFRTTSMLLKYTRIELIIVFWFVHNLFNERYNEKPCCHEKWHFSINCCGFQNNFSSYCQEFLKRLFMNIYSFLYDDTAYLLHIFYKLFSCTCYYIETTKTLIIGQTCHGYVESTSCQVKVYYHISTS